MKAEDLSVSNENGAEKRVLIFSLAYHPFIGGAEVAVREITNRLPNIAFDMITLRIDAKLPEFERIDNVNVYRIGFVSSRRKVVFPLRFPFSLNKYLFPFWAFYKAKSLHKKYNYDAVWSIMANYAGFAGLFFKTANRSVPFLLTLQEGDPIAHIYKRVRFVRPLFKRIFTRADTIQAISNHLASFAKDIGHITPVEVVPNGVDIARFTKNYSEYELDELKHELGKKTSSGGSPEEGIPSYTADVFLITTSRLVPKNGVMDIVQSLIYLPPNIKLLILGDGPEMGRLRDFADANNILERIHFFSFIPYADVPKYLQVSDIFIRPSLSEGFGNSFIEAMAVGLPVIATPVGGIVDFLFDPMVDPDKEPTGVFCRVGDPQSIAKSVELLLSDENLRERIVSNAKKMVEEKYDWNIIALNMQKIFNALFSK